MHRGRRPDRLPDIVPGVIESRLTEVALSLDQNLNGSSDSPFVASRTPRSRRTCRRSGRQASTGRLFPSLGPGDYEVCARATGSDGGGTDS